MPVFPIRLFGWGVHRVTVGLCFTTRSPVTFLKSINGARHVLGIQHGNQLGQCLFSIPRSSIAETLIFIVIVMALIAATVMWGCPAEVVDTVEKAAVTTPRCTVPIVVSTAPGATTPAAVEWPGVALARKVRSATCLEGCACGQSRRVPPSSSCLISIFRGGIARQ
jgi:hypothetical protein